MFGTLSQPPHPQISRNSGVSPAAVSERAEPPAAGARGGCVRGVGAQQFRGCSPSGGGIASTPEQRWWGRAPEGVTVDVGPKTLGAGRKAGVGRPPPRPRAAGAFGRGGRSGGGVGSEVFSPYWKRCQELRGGAHDGFRAAVSGAAPVTLHPERAGISRVGAAGGRSCRRDPTGGR